MKHSHTPSLGRRDFLKLTGAALGASLPMAGRAAFAGPFEAGDVPDHFVPTDKKLRPDWVRALTERGEAEWFSGKDLDTIGMPVGGLCAGQVYLTGDGRLTYWDIFNQQHNSGYGAHNYRVGRAPTTASSRQGLFEMPPLQQGVCIRVRQGDDLAVRTLDRSGFPGVRFRGAYPIATVDFADEFLPVEVRLEAYSPFIPLNAEDSSLPATLLEYTVRNRSDRPADIDLTAWLENDVCRHTLQTFSGRLVRRYDTFREAGATGVLGRASVDDAEPSQPPREPIVFADFEGVGYGDWEAEGDAFGEGPARGTLADQQAVSGFSGQGLVNTFMGGDGPHGQLRSPAFSIERDWITFRVGGGGHADRTCINLVIDGKTVRSVTGKDREALEPAGWNVADLTGREARIEIVDAASDGWGHINIDQIEFRDEPVSAMTGALEEQSDFGTLALAVLGGDECQAAPTQDPDDPRVPLPTSFVSEAVPPLADVKASGDARRIGAVRRGVTLAAGEQTTVVFVVAWHMPNLRRGERMVGHQYANRFDDAREVIAYVAAHRDRLARDTRLWRDTYYDSSLPVWLLDRLHSTLCNLATTTCQWWKNGRFWAWEGCGCCHGTCGHVWNYEHGLARLFPALERSVREQQDFAPGVGLEEDGSISFRGEGWNRWAGDSQGGYILKAYREHLCSDDASFLREHWPYIRRATAFLIGEDGNGDGLLEGRQHQTYDQDYFGANTMVGSLYLGALRAAEAMAEEVGDRSFADQCRRLFASGSALSSERLFNGDYFVQDVDLEDHPDWQYADGCLADQLFGQGWAHQVGLGMLYPKEQVRKALQSIWAYCWTPDIETQNRRHRPERWFAYPGEAGLLTCTWPKGRHLGPKSTRYRNEVWTGIEYQVAGHMVWEGMLTEALAICRAIHERYHPAKHNPWNEIECGDHYARALASWGVFTALCGFEYHGPRGHIVFAPRLQPEDFRAAFTAAEGWGTVEQKQAHHRQTNRLILRHGALRLTRITQTLPETTTVGSVEIQIDGQAAPSQWTADKTQIEVRFEPIRLEAGQTLDVSIRLG